MYHILLHMHEIVWIKPMPDKLFLKSSFGYKDKGT